MVFIPACFQARRPPARWATFVRPAAMARCMADCERAPVPHANTSRPGGSLLGSNEESGHSTAPSMRSAAYSAGSRTSISTTPGRPNMPQSSAGSRSWVAVVMGGCLRRSGEQRNGVGGDGEGGGKARAFDAEQIDQARDAMDGRSLDDEIRHAV